MVYHLHNLVDNVRIRFKVFTDIKQPDVLLQQIYLKPPTGWKEKHMIFTG